MSYFVAQKVTKRQKRARRNGILCFSSEVEQSPQSDRSPVRFRHTPRPVNAKTRFGMFRKWLNAEVLGQFGGLKCRKLFKPWQRAARLGSPHSELARLTVSKLLTRNVRRVNRHTPKKAVMVIDWHARFGAMSVDKRATIARQAVGTPANG